MNRQRLASWIQAGHLEDAALQSYRRAFAAHPARVLVVRDFLVPAVADRLSRFLAQEAEFKSEFGLYSIEGAVTEADWLAAPDADRLFRLGKLVGTPPQFQTSPNALTYLQFRMIFQQPDFRGFFEAVSGMQLGGSDDFGAHAMTVGDVLRPHSDDNKNRQVAIVIYLTPDWQPEAGGVLKVLHKDETVTDVIPVYNSMVVFDVLTAPAHYVTAIATQHGAPPRRLSIGGWYPKAG